jgi:homeobox protein cut-like
LAELQTLLLEYSDYNEIKRELDIFKGNEMESSGDLPLERILLEKNKKMENDYTNLKMDYQSLQESMSLNVAKLEHVESENVKKTALISQMEVDIHRLNQLQSRQPNVFLMLRARNI